ncbi:MAG: 3-methyl-2-oxobutanoate hydroxymethyltransferase [Firmicutes bacterium]|jgi:3-methyl-2-oxobutanoate hydroxymethyltransferase|uniref:3-methyl-2-oxobutanoate hydroxymethyltransferase n=1 Tax=Sulfobacillus benefaciens TaxID=453960 RepID=A0A2T2X069_9FIRM|nr:3-methyl-2-oxobutanoate hydroxymethyltransferase [Bacillota bacterium]MCL5014477.1 3-methyl-2-oxobutanoate hydroxymethyltransferase [Bacillota bacterium]PSR27885.1 MAG: 3-methyl-2-oxobutanoate hydroxymethyltransferase [Sulfobacillus benefaciens]
MLTSPELRALKGQRPSVWITAYDVVQAQVAEEAGIDVILVGDSLGMTTMGYDTTIPVTLDDMIHHAAMVRRGATHTMMIVDFPFLTYPDIPTALRNAARIMQQTLANGVKLEGGRDIIAVVDALIREKIPVIGHLGLTPQSIHTMGGYKVQAKTSAAIERLIADARELSDHGVSAIVLEGIPDRVAAFVTDHVDAPTVGIGAGSHVDGQVLVFHDCLGLSPNLPKFARPFAHVRDDMIHGLEDYRNAVLGRSFPSDAETYHIPDREWERFLAEYKD